MSLALTLAGTTIQNQASATYAVCLDKACATRSDPQYVTSNLVETLIQPMLACSLAPGANGSVSYSVRVQ